MKYRITAIAAALVGLGASMVGGPAAAASTYSQGRLITVLPTAGTPLAAGASATAQSGTSAPCFGQSQTSPGRTPSCTSSIPTVTVGTYGGTVGCTFTTDITWGDGGSSSGTYGGQPNDGLDVSWNHTYGGTSGTTYDLTITTTAVAPCSGSEVFNWTFTLAHAPVNPRPCATATKTYEADQKIFDTLLGRLGGAQAHQADAERRVSALSQEEDADNALIAKVEAIQTASEDDAHVVAQTIDDLTGAVQKIEKMPLDMAAETLIERLETIIKNALDGVETVDKDLADSFWERAAALDSEEAARAGRLIGIIDSSILRALGLPELVSMSVDAGRIVTGDITLEYDLARLSQQEDAYHQATNHIHALETNLDTARAELDSDNADVKALTAKVDAAQAAADAAFIAMTKACEA